MKKRNNARPVQKISYNELRRRNKKLEELAGMANKSSKANYDTLCVVATKLYISSPEDEIFTNETFLPGFLEKIKDAAKKQQEASDEELKKSLEGSVG